MVDMTAIQFIPMVVWLSSNDVVHISEVALHQARSVPRWVTIQYYFGT